MPKIREGFRQLATQVPADAYPLLEALAARNGRSVVDELAHAIRRHLAAPPTVRVVVETPPLPAADVDAPVPKPTRRRKPKRP